jgi:hypothetical protein
VIDQKHKTPEELGEAVGKKIEELFGGMFSDEESVASQPSIPAKEAPRPPASPAKAKPVAAQDARAAAAPKKTGPQVAPAQEKRARPAAAPRQTPSPAASAQPLEKGPNVFDQIMERIEILILNLEWEVSPDSVKEISEKLGQLEPLVPAEGPGRAIVSMNLRVLQRFKTPDAVPHRSLLKLLQDSVSALKLIHSTQGKQVPGQALVSAITTSYKEIIASAASTEAPPSAAASAPNAEQSPFAAVMNNVGRVARSLEEVSQRFARILGVLRQGGTMSPEEITRRLGTLEQLLSERVGQLSSYHKEIADLRTPTAEGLVEESPSLAGDNGLLLAVWAGIHMAVPLKIIAAVYRLSKSQGQEFMNARAIRMGDAMLIRLPIKRPAGGAPAVPEWLLHLVPSGRREYFVTPDKLLGYRIAPKDVNVATQARIKIGAISYVTINQAVLR